MRDRDLVRLYWPVELRPAFDALFAIDDAMADAVAKATDPTLAAIKLAWWRERLEGLDEGQVPAEPRLQSVAADLILRGITGSALALLEAGWAELLQPVSDPEVAIGRGATLFHLAGHLLGNTPPPVLETAGRFYAAGQLHRLGRSVVNPWVVTELRGIPRQYRPLTALAALAERDLRLAEPEATPGRAWALLRHRWTGRIG